MLVDVEPARQIAASSRTEGKAVGATLHLEIVQIAFTRGACPMRERKAAIEHGGELFYGGLEHGRLLGDGGRGGQFAFGNGLAERRFAVDVELVAVHAVETDALGGFDVVQPDIHGLHGEAEDKVNDDGGLLIAHEQFEAAQDFFSVGKAGHGLAYLGVEGLHAEGEAVGSALKAGFHLVLPEVVQTAFDGDFAVVGQRQVAAYGLEQTFEVGSFQRGRRSAAEVYGVHGALFLRGAAFPEGKLLDERIGVAGAFFLAVALIVEAAVEAVSLAERHVDVGHAFPFARLVE